MSLKFRILSLLVTGALLTACNPFGADLKDAIVGRWQSPIWKFGQEAVFAQFAADGSVEFLYYGSKLTSKWIILDSGELQITSRSGDSQRCKAFVEGKTLRIEPPACFRWEDMGPIIALEKQ